MMLMRQQRFTSQEATGKAKENTIHPINKREEKKNEAVSKLCISIECKSIITPFLQLICILCIAKQKCHTQFHLLVFFRVHLFSFSFSSLFVPSRLFLIASYRFCVCLLHNPMNVLARDFLFLSPKNFCFCFWINSETQSIFSYGIFILQKICCWKLFHLDRWPDIVCHWNENTALNSLSCAVFPGDTEIHTKHRTFYVSFYV